MALNGSVKTSAYMGRYLQLTWSATQDVAENTSTISWTLKGAGTSTEGVEYYDSGPFTVVMDGETVFASETRIPLYNGTQVASGKKVLQHNTDGTKTFDVGIVAGIHASAVNCAGSAVCALTPIQMLESPTITELSITEGNPAMAELTGDTGNLVRFYSIVIVRVKATAHNGVGMASLTVSCEDGKKLQADGDTLEGTLYGVESGKFTVTAVDNRGNRTEKQLNFPMIPYVKLTCVLENTRPNSDGKMTLRVHGNFFDGFLGTTDNSITIIGYRYKILGGEYSNWITMSPTILEGNAYTATEELTGLNNQTTYVFQARVQDRLLNKMVSLRYTPECTVKATPVFDWGEKDFNVNGTFKINEQAVADFVVEQGIYGSWNYRKWNSGLAECWGQAAKTINVSQGAGSLYYSGTFAGLDYPPQVAFVKAPSCFAALRANAYKAWLTTAEEGTLVKTPGYMILAPNANSGNQYTVEYRAVGFWK